jgi:hypothetical protein
MKLAAAVAGAAKFVPLRYSIFSLVHAAASAHAISAETIN